MTSTNRYSQSLPSGEKLPLILQRKLEKHSEIDPSFPSRPTNQRVRVLAEHKDRVFTSDELEDLLMQTSRALVSTQRQIQLGEDLYWDETPHGSIFTGWDIDARIGQGQARRMANDSRWFSSSVSYSRHLHAPSRILPEQLVAGGTAVSKAVPPAPVIETTTIAAVVKGPETTKETEEDTEVKRIGANDEDESVEDKPLANKEIEDQTKPEKADKAELKESKRKAIAEPVASRRPKRVRRKP